MKKITTISKTRLRLKLIACIYPLVYLITLPMIYGILPSYSSYYILAQDWFTYATISMAFSMWLHRDLRWSWPSYALIGVAVFNCVDYRIMHSIFAVLFFLSSTYLMVSDKRFKSIGLISIPWYILLIFPGGIFWFEIVQASLISWFHMKYILLWMKVRRQ